MGNSLVLTFLISKGGPSVTYSMACENRFLRQIAVTGWCLLMLALTFGCRGSLGFSNRKMNTEDLKLAVTTFNDAIRWRDYQKALLWIVPQQQEAFWKQTDDIQDRLRVIDYEIIRFDFNERAAIGTVDLRYRVYYLTDPRMQVKTLHQKWRYEEAQKDWRVAHSDLQSLAGGGF
jgi:hypothetical protein